MRARIVVRGVVQGVGFRPFVYRLAAEHNLNGWVLNSTEGVVVEVEGEALDGFLAGLETRRPPLARIDRIETTYLPPVGYTAFAIEPSVESASAAALVSPDVCICDDCRREIFDPDDRRHGYPFTNCTNCGPRFTIVRDIPYDRPATTMATFAMCPNCQAEYDDPSRRRFHAQPNACPDCGPAATTLTTGETASGPDALPLARRLLAEGMIVAIKGVGGFHLACDATNARAVAELRARKRRVDKPFAVMVRDIDEAARICHLDEAEARLLESPQRPIVLLRRRDGVEVAPAVAPRNASLGVMLPYTPLHYLLFAEGLLSLVMTSGNLSEEPIATGNDEALERLSGLADAFVLHDRAIHVRCDDSVTRVVAGKESIIRRSRGYAPYPVRLHAAGRRVLACGAELKNTFCLTREDYAFISQHIGDLENEETLRSFEEGIAHYCRLFHVTPEAVAYDLHPDYLSTRYAMRQRTALSLASEKLIGVQHHHAHVASAMAENGLDGMVIGVAFDGTGYGLDGAIWGGEFLLASYEDFRRVGHLRYVPLPGGEAAVRRPYRTAASYAQAAYGSLEPALSLLRKYTALESLAGAVPVAVAARGVAVPGNRGPGPQVRLHDAEIEVLARQVGGALNSPNTSSAGRLFDAVSSLAGVCQTVNYEGQAAIELEMVADTSDKSAYAMPLLGSAESFVVDWTDLIREVVEDARVGTPAGTMSARFHNGLASAVVNACRLIGNASGLKRVVLSGGVFQNQLLLARVADDLTGSGFAVYTQHQVPCNDGGISLGQAAVASARLRADA